MAPVNPYARAATAAAAAEPQQGKDGPQSDNMGPQSQRRLTLMERTHNLQASNHRKKKQRVTGQQTLFGDRAFDPLKDCEVCKGKLVGRSVHRAHHQLCYNKRGGAAISKSAMATMQEEKRLQSLFSTPLTEAEKCSGRYLTKEATAEYFAPRTGHSVSTTVKTKTIIQTEMTSEMTSTISTGTSVVTANDLCRSVTTILEDPKFVEGNNSRAPPPMIAFAKTVVEKILRPRGSNIHEYFNGLTITVPDTKEVMPPQYHSIVGQKLLNVDWQTMYGIDVACPRCKGVLKNDRTNFSKNKILFPIFVMEGPPLWCMVMSMTCANPACRTRMNSNSCEILCQLPAYARNAYPVETKYALDNKNSHIGKTATTVFDLLMPTYGNGDLCSRLLYRSMNQSYADRVEEFYAYYKSRSEIKEAPAYVENYGYYITVFPPLGDTIRDVYDAACSNVCTPWKISDHDRHVREIQGVSCHSSFAQDHTHEVCKNYYQKKQLGANALWDVATETGEIASAVLVPSTKTIHFAHAAMSLTRRPSFKPTIMYSDTWPAKSDFWEAISENALTGRLGLFHYIQRITRTLKKNHIDHFQSITSLLNCIYTYNHDDHENLLRALKEGSLNATKYTDDDIQDLKGSKLFRQRYDKYLRKEIRPPNVLCSMLDDWFDRFKCSSSSGDSSRPARGRKDPMTDETLFSSDTKGTVEECKKKAPYIQDPLPIEEMYDLINPSVNSPHQLKEYISRRGESCLESFHLMLAHFGNCGMRASLADNLNLTGTARFNLAVRQKRTLIALTAENPTRKKIPSAYESVVSFFNHSELAHINTIAIAAGVSPNNLPFTRVEPLQKDNGERFFSEYLKWMKDAKPRYDNLCRCLCADCGIKPTVAEAELEMLSHCYPNNQGYDGPEDELQQQQTQPRNNNSPDIPTLATVHQQTSVQPRELVGDNRVVRVVEQQQQQQLVPVIQTQAVIQTQSHQHHHHPQSPMMYYQPMTNLFTPYPWIATHPITTPTTPSYCCSRYRAWHNTPGRRGRPPHSDHCQHQFMRRRMHQSGGQQLNGQDNPSWQML